MQRLTQQNFRAVLDGIAARVAIGRGQGGARVTCR